MVTLHEVITFLVSMQISISSLQTHNVNRCGRSRHLARKLSLRRKRSSPNVFEMAATETITSIILIKLIRVSLGTVRHPRRFKIVVIDIQITLKQMLRDFIGIRVNRAKKSGMVNITSSVNSRGRSGINTILHELNVLFSIHVTMRDIKCINVYSRVMAFLKVRCRLALLPFLISCLIWLDLVASLPLIKERILVIILLLHFLSLMLGSVLVLMLPLLVWLTPDLRIKKSLLKCNWTIRKRLPR